MNGKNAKFFIAVENELNLVNYEIYVKVVASKLYFYDIKLSGITKEVV